MMTAMYMTMVMNDDDDDEKYKDYGDGNDDPMTIAMMTVTMTMTKMTVTMTRMTVTMTRMTVTTTTIIDTMTDDNRYNDKDDSDFDEYFGGNISAGTSCSLSHTMLI